MSVGNLCDLYSVREVSLGVSTFQLHHYNWYQPGRNVWEKMLTNRELETRLESLETTSQDAQEATKKSESMQQMLENLVSSIAKLNGSKAILNNVEPISVVVGATLSVRLCTYTIFYV